MNRGKTRMTVALFLCPLAFTVGSASAQNSSPPIRPVPAAASPSPQSPGAAGESAAERLLKAQKDAWTRFFRPIAAGEHASMFVDIDLAQPIYTVSYQMPQGQLAMLSLASLLQRNWLQIDGVQSFVRIGNTKSPDSFWNQGTTLLEGFQALPPDKMDALLTGDLALDDLPPNFRTFLIRLACACVPSMPAALMDRWQQARIRLSFNPEYKWTDINGKDHYRNLGVDEPPLEVRPRPEDSRPPSLFPPLGRSVPGPLDFGPGSVLSLAEILGKARDAFHQYYERDPRLDNSLYFASGSFTQKAFDDVIKTITQTASTQPQVKQIDLEPGIEDFLFSSGRKLLDQKLAEKGTEWPLTPAQFVGEPMSVSSLTGGNTALLKDFQADGLGPDSVVTLEPGLTLDFDAGGIELLTPGPNPTGMRARLYLDIP